MKPEAAPTASLAGRVVERAALEGRLDPFLLSRMGRNGQEFSIREVRPRLTWNRLDLAIKLYYLKQSEAGNSRFAEELYDAHIHAFSLGDFREPGNEAKTDAVSFRTAFRDILNDLRQTGFDPEKSLIPAATDGSFINGGHRAACALYLGYNVHVVETRLPPVCYDARFFRSRGMDEDLLEAAILKYVELNLDARVALILPGAGTPSEVERHLAPLAYKKQVRLSANGITNLLKSIETDLGRAAPLPPTGAANAPQARFYVFQDNHGDGGTARETELRELAGQGGHVILLPASREQGLELARVLLNERSIRFLNLASPGKHPDTINVVRQFRVALDQSGASRDEVILGPGMVPAAFGLRKAAGVDAVAPSTIETAALAVGARPRPQDLHDILEDPRRHFHAWGLKFLSVGEAIQVLRRDPASHADDLRLLARLLPKAEPRQWLHKLRGTVRMHYSRVRRLAIRSVVGLGLREQASVLHGALRRVRR